MSDGERLTAAGLARRWAGVVRYAAVEQWKGSHQAAADAHRLAGQLDKAEGFETFARVLEKGEELPMFLDDDKTPTVATDVTTMKET